MLAVAAQAADAFASNHPMPAEVKAAAGHRFDLILPFGCEMPGALESTGSMRWSFDPKATRLRVTVEPVIWQAEPWIDAVDDGGEPTLRGFWISRPWSSSTSCAAVRKAVAVTDGTPILRAGEWVAIARMIGPGEGEKVRPYEVVQRATAADFDPAHGFQFRITGRIRTASEGGPVKCVQPGGGDQRPLCVITATFSEVHIENPKNGDVLASWSIEDDVRSADDSAASNSATGRR